MEPKNTPDNTAHTYSVAGSYYTPANADFFICLPPEEDNTYTFNEDVYNVSYEDGLPAKINAILILLTDETGDVLSAEDNYIRQQFDITSPVRVGDAAAFNSSAEEILVVVFHDNAHSTEDKLHILSKVPEYYSRVLVNGPYNEDLYPQAAIPRRVGMSLVKKKGS